MISTSRMRALVLSLVLAGGGSASADTDVMNSVGPAEATEAGLEAIEQEEFIKAANIFEQAVLANPQNVPLNRHLGIGYYKSGRNKSAIEQLQKTRNLSEQDAETHYALGVVYLARASEVSVLKIRGVLKNSIQHLEKAIELEPGHTAARYYLIQLLINAPKVMGGDPERARLLNEKLADLSPLHHQVINSTLAAENEDHATAEKLLRDSLKQEPYSTLVNFSLLSFYHGRKQYEKAIQFGEAYLRLPRAWDDTDAASAHFLLAEAYQRQGESQRSLEHYALVLTHTDNEKVIKRVQDAVKELQGDA